MRRGKGHNRGNKPRQPGGNRQEAGPRHKFGKSRPHKPSTRHPEERGAQRRASKGDGPRRQHEDRGRSSFEARPPKRVEDARPRSHGGLAPQDDGSKTAPFVSAGVQTVTVTPDENNMRVDRFFEARFPGLSFSHIQRIIRKGEVRVNGKRTEPKARLETGQSVRIPPLSLAAPKPRDDAPAALKDRAFLKSITLYEDDDVMVLNKPAGLAVQGGSGTTRHIDGMLGALQGQHKDAQRPRLVHRLDKDTAGCLLIAKTRFAAAALSKTFRSRSARKFYWALVAGVPKPPQGRISTYLAKQEVEEDSFMRVAKHGDKDAMHAVTYYAIVETSAQSLAWISLKPVTGRTHQLRAHMAHVGNPIVGDPKYFNIENWHLPGGMQNKLHLLARRIVIAHPRGGKIDVSAPLPEHMQQTWNLLGLDTSRYDPIEEAPEE
jgi:23S rRNA pseudouridine955/2504/2580 synthase